MTSELSAEPTMPMLGPSDSSTAGNESRIDIARMAIGGHGAYPVLGSFERGLAAILDLGGMPKESIAVTVQAIIPFAQAWRHTEQALSILDTLERATEPPKPKSTSTSESQNEEMG